MPCSRSADGVSSATCCKLGCSLPSCRTTASDCSVPCSTTGLATVPASDARAAVAFESGWLEHAATPERPRSNRLSAGIEAREHDTLAGFVIGKVSRGIGEADVW